MFEYLFPFNWNFSFQPHLLILPHHNIVLSLHTHREQTFFFNGIKGRRGRERENRGGNKRRGGRRGQRKRKGREGDKEVILGNSNRISVFYFFLVFQIYYVWYPEWKGEFEEKWIHGYVCLGPYAVHLNLSQHCLLIGYTLIQNKSKK